MKKKPLHEGERYTPSLAELVADPAPGPAAAKIKRAWSSLPSDVQRLAEPLAAVIGRHLSHEGFWEGLPTGAQRTFTYSIVAALAEAKALADAAEDLP